MNKQRFIIFSPVLVVLLSAIVIRLAEPTLGVWAWVPWILVYWISICFLALWGSEKNAIKRWLAHPQGSWLWSGLVILLALPGLPMFISSWGLLKPVYVWLPWLLVGLINPFLEEWYWRGLLLDKTSHWFSSVSIPGISVFFMLNHWLGIGYTSIGCRHPILLINTIVLGIIYGVVYKKTNSLRWLIIAHAISDLLGISVAVFLNLWVPPG